VSDNIVVIGPEKLAAMVNGVIRCLAGQGIFAKDLDVVLDGTDNEATPTYQTDDGRAVPHVTREKRPDVRANRHAKKVKVQVGFQKIPECGENGSHVLISQFQDLCLHRIERLRENLPGSDDEGTTPLIVHFLDAQAMGDRQQSERLLGGNV